MRKSQKRSWIVTVLCISLFFSLTGCGQALQKQSAPGNIKNLIQQMGAGWNLGNSLESVDFKQLGETGKKQFRNSYKAMMIYESAPYSGWDASSQQPVRWGLDALEWKISDVKSDSQSACGKFIIQLFNEKLKNSGSGKVTATINNAVFIKADGSEISLSPWDGSYETDICDSKSKNIELSLKEISELERTSDIVGGTLKLNISLSNYPDTVEPGTFADDTVKAYETLWGNPQTTKAMIDQVKEAGFGTVRVPVSYYDHLQEDGTIDKVWLKRVATVVSYVLDNDMYCVIDVHHDTGNNSWINADADKLEENKEKLTLLWKQIGNYFKDYDEKLIFEGMNEVLTSKNDWMSTDQDVFDSVNALNQTFVDTIRKQGGNNASRYLITNVYASSNRAEVLSAFELPKDSIKDHIMVDIHSYEDTADLDAVFSRIDEALINRKIPVFIGEFGKKHIENSTSTEEQLTYMKQFIKMAKERNMPYCWWDDGKSFADSKMVNNFSLFNRDTLTWYFPKLTEALTAKD